MSASRRRGLPPVSCTRSTSTKPGPASNVTVCSALPVQCSLYPRSQEFFHHHSGTMVPRAASTNRHGLVGCALAQNGDHGETNQFKTVHVSSCQFMCCQCEPGMPGYTSASPARHQRVISASPARHILHVRQGIELRRIELRRIELRRIELCAALLLAVFLVVCSCTGNASVQCS